MNAAGALTIIIGVLGIVGYLGYQEVITEKLGMNFNENKTIVVPQDFPMVMQGLKDGAPDGFVLCAYGKYITPKIVSIEEVEECGGSDDFVAFIVSRPGDSGCEASISDYDYVRRGKLVGVVCSKGLRFYDVDSMDASYRVVEGEKI